MSPHAAPQSPARPGQIAPAAERRRGPAPFRGSLERRLPAGAQVLDADDLLPPVGRSEAFAEDLFDDDVALAGTPSGGSGQAWARLRWLGLPVLALGVGLSVGLAGF